MQDITTQTDMQDTIKQLESRRDIEQRDLKIQLETAYESLKPANLIRNTFKEVVGSKDIRGNVVNASIGLAAGIVTRKLFVGFSHSPVRKVLGTLLMFGITNLVSKRPELIPSIGKKIWNWVGKKKRTAVDDELETEANYTDN